MRRNASILHVEQLKPAAPLSKTIDDLRQIRLVEKVWVVSRQNPLVDASPRDLFPAESGRSIKAGMLVCGDEVEDWNVK